MEEENTLKFLAFCSYLVETKNEFNFKIALVKNI